MKAVVLAAGEGKRMKPVSNIIPKMMIPVLDRPFLEYVLMEIKGAGIMDVVLVVSPKNGSAIREYFGDGKRLGMKIEYAMQEQRNGTAHAISRARECLDCEYFLVHYGDSLTDNSLPSMLVRNFKKEKELDAFLTLREERETQRYGVARFEGRDITEIVEKPPAGTEPGKMVTMGTFVLKTKSFFDSIGGVNFVYGKEQFPAQYILKRGGMVRGWSFSGKRVDLGKPEDIISASRLVMKKLSMGIGSYTGKNVNLGENSEIKDSFVNGNTKIGNNSLLENSYVMGNCTIGKNCKVKNSIVCRDLADGTVLENGVVV